MSMVWLSGMSKKFSLGLGGGEPLLEVLGSVPETAFVLLCLPPPAAPLEVARGGILLRLICCSIIEIR